ncbi:NADH dehydrogenase (ubiquinone) 15 kDa subunit isoform X2 [Calliopsis andreniformis]
MWFYITPLIKAPWTEITSNIGTYQQHPECRDFEFRLADCVEAYGWYRSLEKCDLLFKDLEECAYNLKRNKRLGIMLQERKRQGRTSFIPPPPTDMF